MDTNDDDPRASQHFVRMASAFLDEVAPDFHCSVCKTEAFEVVEKLKGDYHPFIYSINYDTNREKRYRQWLLVCSNCGCTYSFGREPLLAWAEARGMTGDD
ncbi:hypothetical protein [uncultured Methylobacterium sp.]|uniref:hypothetical protein n=1 Tax=uncultured Methylobacterium sp. TaxID=157278 RepID=UPI0035CBB32B